MRADFDSDSASPNLTENLKRFPAVNGDLTRTWISLPKFRKPLNRI